jgi:hypothetical protein
MADRARTQTSSSAAGETSWWSSIRRIFNSSPESPSYNDDQDEEDEPLLPLQSAKRRKLRTGWEQVIAYLALLALGVVVGGFIGRRYASGTEEKGHGPMVAPVWTLPPVSHHLNVRWSQD